MIKKLRWATDSAFWDLDAATPVTIDGGARPVPGDVLPLGLSRGSKLSRPKQLDFMHRFMALPLVPCYAGNPARGGDGFALQRALSLNFGENWFTTLLGQFNLQKLISSIKSSSPRNPSEASWIGRIGRHLCDKSLYAIGFCSEFLIEPDLSFLVNTEVYADKKGRRNKAVIFQKLPNHNLTLEATWPGLFIDELGSYWDVPLSMSIDLASVASDSGPSHHLCLSCNNGHPKQFGGDETTGVPMSILPGLCFKAAYSVKKDGDIWRSKEGKLKMVQPFDMLLFEPHISASTIIGSIITATLGNNSVRSVTEDGALSVLAQGNKYVLLADLFASVSCIAQYGNFQRLFLDLTRLNARLDFPSGSKFLTGATSLAHSFYRYQWPDTEAVHAICPEVTLTLQQQIIGAASFRVDSKIKFHPEAQNGFAVLDESIFAIEYALKVLGSAKAVAWYSPKRQEAMVELRFFES